MEETEKCESCNSPRLEMDHWKDGVRCLDCGRFHLWRVIEDKDV